MSVPWTNAVIDCRKTLSDQDNDKLLYQKKVIGQMQDGVNKTFKTFETRRVSSFLTPVYPCGVYVNNVLAVVTQEDLISGQFELDVAPGNSDSVVATYYVQWFLDEELEEFLATASIWCGFTEDYLTLPDTFRPAAKEYVAFLAYQKLVSKMAVNLAETYQLYDAPDEKRFNPVDMYMKISKVKYDLAVKLRDDVYTRKGQAQAPRSKTLVGTVRDVPPNR